MFVVRSKSDRELHGKRLDTSRFRQDIILSATDLPNVVLLGWHYRQSAMTRFRGFAYGMEVNRMGGDVPRPEGAPEPGPDD
jgi:hypothetical protein